MDAHFQWDSIVATQDDGRLLRDVLRGSLGISRQFLHELKYTGAILLNGQPVTVRALVRTGDHIRLTLRDSYNSRVAPEPLPLQIVYEDEDILVVNKSAGMIVHPVPPEPAGTLANAIAWHWQQSQDDRPVRLITRIDRDTTGLVLVAKHAFAQHFYTTRPDAIEKHYLALVAGSLGAQSGSIVAPIAVNAKNPVTRLISSDGKPSETRYRVIDRLDAVTLLDATLVTGRTHQIRVHFSWLGHPLLGDDQYGGPMELIGRQALHSYRLILTHVRSKEQLVLTAQLPPDMHRLLRRLKETSSS